MKSAPETPWNAIRLGRLTAEKTDIPTGVVNIVTASDHLVGEVLTTSPDVDLVAFTGSTVTGVRIMEAAAKTLKPVFLELGVKSVNLYLDDADFEEALPGAVGACIHAGRGFAIPSRIMVPGARYAEAVELVRRVSTAGPTAIRPDPPNKQGPLVSEKQR